MVDTTLWGTILFVSIVSMTPGPNNLLLAASGANYGFIKTLPHMCGVIVGFAIMVVASGCPFEMINQIGSWSSIGTIGSKYGQGYELDAIRDQFSAVKLY